MTRDKAVERILELKGITREQLEAEVKTARERRKQEQDKADALEREYRRVSDEFLAKQSRGSVEARELELVYSYLKHASREIEQQKLIVEIRTGELDQRMSELVEAHKEKRLLETLHDRFVRVKTKALDRNEQKEADFQFLLKKGKQ
jgi:flagellar export protein FliJ